LRTALIPVAKAALVGAAAAMATTSKPIRRAKTGKVAESLQTTQRKVSR
jgi:phosphotransferase system  glucose/maltose/N-acetylglucosamine-specific IIC component